MSMPNTVESTLTAVMVTYNSADVVADALFALPEHVEVVVVDNASSDDTLDVVRRCAPRARIVESGGNLGFARAVNEGARKANGSHLLLLNPDAVITAAAIEQVLQVFAEHPDVGIAAPLVTEGGGELVTMAGGYEPTIWRMFTHSTGLARLAARHPILRGHYLLRGQYATDALTDLKWVSGGCLFASRTVWTDLSGLTERWFMYAEDVEFCLRAGDDGWRVVLVPWAKATHAVGASSAGEAAIRTTWLENLFDLYRHRYKAGPVRTGAWRFVVVSGYAARSAVVRVRGALRGTDSSTDARRFAMYARAALRVKESTR